MSYKLLSAPSVTPVPEQEPADCREVKKRQYCSTSDNGDSCPAQPGEMKNDTDSQRKRADQHENGNDAVADEASKCAAWFLVLGESHAFEWPNDEAHWPGAAASAVRIETGLNRLLPVQCSEKLCGLAIAQGLRKR